MLLTANEEIHCAFTKGDGKKRIFKEKVNCGGLGNGKKQGWANSHSKSVRILTEKVTLWDFYGAWALFEHPP